ncbi:site-2 protease family protein [Actibacterium pelagium]|uniref:Zinc metalloprotease n=1 Tax=Actibacterium pelagium TaxID=2029103 RepID=A0A917AH23_9RHOB|nr:site-2 protease family protein [Actibacterium pelagium]GGE52303.1 protease [Actibacterium pelagium]
MTWSFPIGRLFGSELRVHATFFLLLAWIGGSAWLNGGPEAALVNVTFIIALFACVIAHEFGHALTARRYGIKTPDITLLPIGGMARLERMPEKPGQEILVALAGPAVNIVIWLFLTLLFGASMSLQVVEAIDDPANSFLGRLAAVNLFLALFNLLPAFPMDGGRVLRALLNIRLGRVQATRIAAGAGQLLAFLLGFLGLMSGNPLLLLIGVFIFMAAAAEYSDVALHDRARAARAEDAMITAFESLSVNDDGAAAGQALIRTAQSEFPVLDGQGNMVGVLTRAVLMQDTKELGPNWSVVRAMTGHLPTVARSAPLEEVLDHLSKPDVPAVIVRDRTGTFCGYITRENIGEWLIVNTPPSQA